jgi:ArsR family metal-binding transcriptional regulator
MKRQLELNNEESSALEGLLIGKIHTLVDEAWAKYDLANSPEEKEKYKLAVLDLLSHLPENELHLSTMQ